MMASMSSTVTWPSSAATRAPLESDSDTTVAPSSMHLSAAYWATLPEPEMATRLPAQLPAPAMLEHVADVVDEAVAGGLGADQAITPVEALAGKDALELVALAAVRAEQVADLAATHTDIASGDISVGANVARQLAHEGHAEATDLGVALALGVEVGTTLATTHHHYHQTSQRCCPSLLDSVGFKLTASQGILEDLLEAEELETVRAYVSQPRPSYFFFVVPSFRCLYSRRRSYMDRLTEGCRRRPPL